MRVKFIITTLRNYQTAINVVVKNIHLSQAVVNDPEWMILLVKVGKYNQ